MGQYASCRNYCGYHGLTDPVNAWWETASGYEADDKCAWHNLYRINGYLVQPEFSNVDTVAGQTKPGACVFP